jgi:Cu2+-exporting ATPase
LERMRNVDIVLFDKTGTLTKGTHRVTAVTAADGDEAGLLTLAAAVESDSEHPLARAIVTTARQAGQVPAASKFRSMSGRGVEATVDGTRVTVGGPAIIREHNLEVPAPIEESSNTWKQRGAAVLYVVRDGAVIGALSLEDEIRPESREAVDQLHRLGVRVAMITGDAQQVAQTVGTALKIDEVFAEVLPEAKHSKVAELQARGRRVAMGGSGSTTLPLAQADVGIAIGAGTDVAIESAGIVLASDDPRAVVAIYRLSQAGYRKMIQNLAWAAGYNVVAIPLAAGALAWAGIVLAPAAAALLMSLSTVIVAINAQLLRGLRFEVGGSRF